MQQKVLSVNPFPNTSCKLSWIRSSSYLAIPGLNVVLGGSIIRRLGRATYNQGYSFTRAGSLKVGYLETRVKSLTCNWVYLLKD